MTHEEITYKIKQEVSDTKTQTMIVFVTNTTGDILRGHLNMSLVKMKRNLELRSPAWQPSCL